MITLNDFKTDIGQAAMFIINKIAFNRKLGFSAGYDNLNYWQFASSLNVRLNRIKRQINREEFAFSPMKKITKKLKFSKTRDIFISTWPDKIVERWLLENIGSILHKTFSPNSYAYRFNDVGLDSCIIGVKKAISGTSYIIKRDVKNYFPTVDHDILLKKLAAIIDPDSYLFKLLKQRILFEYIENENTLVSNIGIPFGSTLACLFANVYLNDLDHEIDKVGVSYFRYADDMLIVTNDQNKYQLSKNIIDTTIPQLKLAFKESATINNQISDVFTKFNHLGFEITCKNFRLAVEKQRKIINFYKKVLKANKAKINKIHGHEGKLTFIVKICNEILDDRIRSSAIVDYYLHHINDEKQLQLIDRIIAQEIISAITGKTFKNRHYKITSPKKLRELGLISLLHRSRLIRHGHLKVNFLSLFNKLSVQKHEQSQEAYFTKINKIKLYHKLRKLDLEKTQAAGDQDGQ